MNQDSAGGSNVRPIRAPQPDPVLEELERILIDARFAASPSLSRFLRYTVIETLGGRTGELREGALGLTVFDRGDNFDPRMDPIVRVQARKLRARLEDYYEHEGATDPVRILLPRGSYVPRFMPSPAVPGTPAAPAVPSVSAGTASSMPAGRRWNRAWAVAVAAALALMTVLAWIGLRRRPAPNPVVELRRLTYEAGSTLWPVLSRDGKLLAYSSDRGKGDLNIWVQPVHGGAPLQLTHQESPGLSPDFSPDGMWIAFRSRHRGGGIAVVSVFGGEERRLADAGWLPRYSPDAAWIAYQGRGALSVVPSGGGQSREVASGNIELRDGPLWSPDGKRLIALGSPRSARPSAARQYDWYAVPWAGGEPVSLGLRSQLLSQGLEGVTEEARPSDWLGGSIVFSMRHGAALNIWKAPINLGTLKVAGPVVQLTSGSSFEAPRCSAAGQIVFWNEVRMTHVYSLRVDRLGRAQGSPEQLTEDSSLAPVGTFPRLSADGARLAYVSSRSGRQAVMLKELDSGKETVALTPVRQDLTLLAADTALMVYAGREPNRQILYIPEPGQPPAPAAGEEFGSVQDWSADARRVLLEAFSHAVLIAWDRDSGKRTEWLKYRAGSLRQASLSGDGKLVALVLSDPAGGFLARFDAAPLSVERLTRVPITAGVVSLHWSPDTALLYFNSPADDHNCLWAQRLDAVTKQPSGSPFPVYHFHSNRLAVWGDWISAGADRLVFPLTELRSDIWMADVTAADLR